MREVGFSLESAFRQFYFRHALRSAPLAVPVAKQQHNINFETQGRYDDARAACFQDSSRFDVFSPAGGTNKNRGTP